MSTGELQLKDILTKVVGDFARDRRAPGYIRWFAERAPEVLFTVGIDLVLEGADTNGVRYLCVQMMKQPSFFVEMTDPWKYTVDQAVKLARGLIAVDRTLDIRLARCLPQRNASLQEGVLLGERAERALQILDEISVGRRIVPVLNHLATHSDTRISSKSALLVGKRVQSLSWARRLLMEGTDPRIRANAIEAFWGVSTKPAMQMFRGGLDDEHNRVVGNSLMGLHLAGDNDVPRYVLKSAEDCKAPFRMTASWVMGRIGDPVYVQALNGLVRDPDPRVRSSALKSLRDIRQEEKWRLYRETEQGLREPEVAVPVEVDMSHNEAGSAPPEIGIDFWLEGGKYTRETRNAGGKAKWIY